MEKLIKTELKSSVFIVNNNIKLYVGEAALYLIKIEEFQADWDVLYHTCSWATVFQSRVFVTSWYQTYTNKYLPIVVAGFQNSKLTGLLTLTMIEDNLIVGAGANQAEYQTWLAIEKNDDFIQQALLEIRKSFPQSKIKFKYIPAKTPLNWLKCGPYWKKRCTLQTFDQPLLKIEEEMIAAELRKKNRREKVNRLKRLGNLTFERLTEYEQFAELFDQLALQYDFRKAAMFNVTYFSSDFHRKEFLLSLFRQGLLHVTVFKLNNEVIASNVGVAGKNWVHLQGMNTHSLFYAKHSPGILHFLMLGMLLSKEGVDVFDLTPGSDAYKDMLANDYTQAYMLTIGSAYDQVKSKLQLGLNAFVKNNVSKLGMKRQALRNLKKKAHFLNDKIRNVKKSGFLVLVKGLIQECQSIKTKEYYIDLSTSIQVSSNLTINCNNLSDLISFEAKGAWQSRWEFLQEAMRRLELGESVYAWCEDGRLLACAWLSNPKLLDITKQQAVSTDGIVARIENIYCHRLGQSRLKQFIMGLSGLLSSRIPVSMLHFSVNTQDYKLSKTLENLGYKRV